MAVVLCPKRFPDAILVPRPKHNTEFVGCTRVNNQGERNDNEEAAVQQQLFLKGKKNGSSEKKTENTVVRRSVGGRPRVTTSAENRYIAIVAKRNRRATSTHVTSMVTASIGKAIFAATVRRRLHMNGLYARVPRVGLSLSVQSRGTLLKWYREHGNWTESDWVNAMFTDESRFALETNHKRKRIWCKQGACNPPQNITEHHAFRGRSIKVWAGISLGYRADLHIFKRGSVKVVWYRDEFLELIERLYAATVCTSFV
ncbi:transposable element Tcb1 transposase [Trichonephila clavipes]|nr:transposable element Tcb1 transposase [Trichonephila clavipes]